MKALMYLYQRSFKNRLRRALRKPITYVYIIAALAYLGILGRLCIVMLKDFSLESPVVLASGLTLVVLFLIPSNVVSYAKRKGLVFTKGDVHFIFPTPQNPKIVLLYAHVKQVAVSLLLGILLVIIGTVFFKTPLWKMLLYFAFACLLQNILEAAMMVILYGNETLSDRMKKSISYLMYALMFTFILVAFLMMKQEGVTLQVAMNFLQSPLIQCIPIVGWNIAVIYLIIVGPTAVNIVCSILYVIAAAVLVTTALRMKCTGAYYEDATKFADDYAEVKARGRNGEMALLGKKKKYGKASIVYRGYYAKAIFYRQLLEYKKNRFFIFSGMSLVCLGLGIGFAIISHFQDFSKMKEFILPGIMAYLIFIFSSMSTKWNKELENPYTYMIPDTAFCKLWYATLMEHVKSLVDALLLTIPVAIALKLSPVQAILSVLLFVCLQACKLYLMIISEAFLGNLLGLLGKQMLRLFLFGIIIGVGFVGAAIGGVVFGVEAAFAGMIVLVGIETLACMFVASISFEKMESIS